MNITLTVTYFYTDHNYFQQIKGTAKGATCVVAQANIYMIQYLYNYSTVLDVINYKREQQFDIKTLQGF